MTDNAIPRDPSVTEYLDLIEPAVRREDAVNLALLMEEETGEPPRMWATSIVGFGTYHYLYGSGRDGDWMRVGFSARKARISLYGLKDHRDSEELLMRLGPHKQGAGCLYVTRLSDIDLHILRHLTRLAHARE